MNICRVQLNTPAVTTFTQSLQSKSALSVQSGNNTITAQDAARQMPQLPIYSYNLVKISFGAGVETNKDSKEWYTNFHRRLKEADDQIKHITSIGYQECVNFGEPQDETIKKYLGAILNKTVIALERKGDVTSKHIKNVGNLMVDFAKEIISEDGNSEGFSMERIKSCGLLHDIGKLRVPIEILQKTDPLTKGERAVLNNHPIVGASKIVAIENGIQDLIQDDGEQLKALHGFSDEKINAIKDKILSASNKFFDYIIPVALLHHCNYDGGERGYISSLSYPLDSWFLNRLKKHGLNLEQKIISPEDMSEDEFGNNKVRITLKGDELPIRVRMASIADSYDAMTADREYVKGKAKTPLEACMELRRCAKTRTEEPNGGGQFDPNLVEKFIKMISRKDQEVAEWLQSAYLPVEYLPCKSLNDL